MFLSLVLILTMIDSGNSKIESLGKRYDTFEKNGFFWVVIFPMQTVFLWPRITPEPR